MQPFQFRGSAAVVTGAASGIGHALALALAARGCDLALLDRDAAGLERTATSIAPRYPTARVTTHTIDLGERSDFAEVTADVLAAHHRIALLANIAGVALGGGFADVSLEDIDWVMAVNFRAPVALTAAFLPSLLATRGSHIVNMSSLFGLVAPAGQVAYASSKFAIRGFTQTLQAELPKRGIGVTVVHPCGIRTNIAANARVGANVSAEQGARGKRDFARMLRMPPETAAAQIVRAIERRQPRLVITREAKLLDVLSRLMPVGHQTLLARASRQRFGQDDCDESAARGAGAAHGAVT